jgi:hypothetical protein
MAQTHDLKVCTPFWEDLYNRRKTFDVRKDERDFREGDKLRLREWDPETDDYTGQWATFEVSYKLDGGSRGIEDGYCVLGVRRL